MTVPLQRLPISLSAKGKISRAKRGAPRDAETKAKISASMKGLVRSAETRAKISAARRRLASLSKEERTAAQAIKAHRAVRAFNELRFTQWGEDLATCTRNGWPNVYKDVMQSSGYANKRKIKTIPGVSDGFSHPEKRILWDHRVRTEKP